MLSSTCIGGAMTGDLHANTRADDVGASTEDAGAGAEDAGASMKTPAPVWRGTSTVALYQWSVDWLWWQLVSVS